MAILKRDAMKQRASPRAKTRRLVIADWLLFGNLLIAFNNIGTAWLMQVSVYPLFAAVPASSFPAYHLAWWESIWGLVFIPVTLDFAAAVAIFWFRPTGVSNGFVWIGLGLQIAQHAGTVFFWAPLMASLDPQNFDQKFPLLLNTHWGRVALVTAYGLLVAWMAIQRWGSGTIPHPDIFRARANVRGRG